MPSMQRGCGELLIFIADRDGLNEPPENCFEGFTSIFPLKFGLQR